MPPTASAPPSIYQNMASMSMGGGAPKSPGKKGDEAGAGAGGTEEKKQILTTLLEVFKKWDKLESDPAGKDIISQMSGLAEKYKKEILKDTGDAAMGGAPGSGETPPPPPAGAAGGGAGGAGGAGAEMAA